MATENAFSLTSKHVRLMPLTATEPFSMIRFLKDSGNSKRKTQLPWWFRRSKQIAVASTWPWTKWPSSLPFSWRHLSRFILLPGFQCNRQVLDNVSSIAVTWYSDPSRDSTVRHTPSWDTLWSMWSSWVREDVMLNFLLVPSCIIEEMLPIASMSPVNML